MICWLTYAFSPTAVHLEIHHYISDMDNSQFGF